MALFYFLPRPLARSGAGGAALPARRHSLRRYKGHGTKMRQGESRGKHLTLETAVG